MKEQQADEIDFSQIELSHKSWPEDDPAFTVNYIQPTHSSSVASSHPHPHRTQPGISTNPLISMSNLKQQGGEKRGKVDIGSIENCRQLFTD